MEAWEVMTSESQERMLAIVTPADLERVEEVCRRWEVRAAVVGRVTGTGRLRIVEGWDGPVLADVPAATLHEDAPLYERPMARPAGQEDRLADDPARSAEGLGVGELASDLLELLRDPAWVYTQYDHQLFLNTVVAPGADAALLRLAGPGVAQEPGGPQRGIALSTDGNSRWCALDPRRGTALTVAESALNVACVGAVPAALVNCLNFGNPEHPEVMWQLSEAIDGMAEACRALDIPVIGGNVSLYNESRGRDIDPSPVVGTIGLVEDLTRVPPTPALVDGQAVVVVAAPGATVSLGGSKWAVERRGQRNGPLPNLDLGAHRRLVEWLAWTVTAADPGIGGVHDVSEGGLALALAEMAVRSGTGFELDLGPLSTGGPAAVDLFGEGPSRVVMSVAAEHLDALVASASSAGLSVVSIGRAGGDALRFATSAGTLALDLQEAVGRSRGSLAAAMAASTH
jgi:phosphoribosylformylglycinamidine synthase